MSTTTIAPTEAAYAERWRQWQLANAESNRNAAVWARIIFTVIFVALTGWLGLLLSARLGI
jgi:type IV secretory pathway component VirB8